MVFGKKRLLLAMAVAATAGGGVAFAQQPPNEPAVWQLERSFCDHTRAGDLAGAMKLIDPDFLGWGATGTSPMHKADLAQALHQQADSGTRLQSCFIQPVASHAAGDMVLVQYVVTNVLVDKSGHTTQFRNRVTHTWIERNGTWQMLGGMGARLP
jgi:ketosteroid isomerase-like protein